MQSWTTPFPIWNQSVVPCLVLTVVSWPAFWFSQQTDKMVWYSHLSKNFLQFIVIYTVKGFSIVSEAKADFFFLEFSCFLCDPVDVGNLTSRSSAISKSSLYIWKFLVHELLKPSLKDFEHNLASMLNEHNWMVMWRFFGIAFLWDWDENWHFPVLWSLLSFPNLLTDECGTFIASSFMILNSSAGIA